ncbi:hypothetical protein NC652_018625 [Populus alba x Populus x berolinensis]|nr:hypothetical protein NC652_018625 [Populus alba x Populus x berolinensis]
MELEKEIEGKMTTCNSSFKIILGSSSLARRQILNEMGYEFTVVTADIDEKSIRKDNPEELVMALAEAKANAIIERLRIEGHVEEDAQATLSCPLFDIPCGVLSYCQVSLIFEVVVSNGMVREKPNSKDEAREFIKGYSGGHAAVIGSVVVSNLTTGMRKGAWEKAEVYFHEIPDEIIDSVIEEGSTLHVAGGLTLEHPLTSPFVEAVVGSTDTVWGLSIALTEKLIKDNLVAAKSLEHYFHPSRMIRTGKLVKQRIQLFSYGNRAAAAAHAISPVKQTCHQLPIFTCRYDPFSNSCVGYKARAEAEGRLLFLKLGYSHEVELTVPPAVRVFCFKNNVVCCTGIDKGRVHQFAASVRSCKPPEVYKGKGIMYIDEVIKKKQGKKSK